MIELFIALLPALTEFAVHMLQLVFAWSSAAYVIGDWNPSRWCRDDRFVALLALGVSSLLQIAWKL